MQILESSISLLVLLSLSLFLLVPTDSRIDNSLYLYELQGDIQNVMHLKSGMENISAGNDAAMEIYGQTSLCMEMGQTQITSYRVKEGASSSQVMVPELRTLLLERNGTLIAFQGLNLTGFNRDALYAGPCK